MSKKKDKPVFPVAPSHPRHNDYHKNNRRTECKETTTSPTTKHIPVNKCDCNEYDAKSISKIRLDLLKHEEDRRKKRAQPLVRELVMSENGINLDTRLSDILKEQRQPRETKHKLNTNVKDSVDELLKSLGFIKIKHVRYGSKEKSYLFAETWYKPSIVIEVGDENRVSKMFRTSPSMTVELSVTDKHVSINYSELPSDDFNNLILRKLEKLKYEFIAKRVY